MALALPLARFGDCYKLSRDTRKGAVAARNRLLSTLTKPDLAKRF